MDRTAPVACSVTCCTCPPTVCRWTFTGHRAAPGHLRPREMFLDDKQFKRIGNVTETIVRFAMELGAEQIVMGARGTSLFGDPAPGSVANTVVQDPESVGEGKSV